MNDKRRKFPRGSKYYCSPDANKVTDASQFQLKTVSQSTKRHVYYPVHSYRRYERKMHCLQTFALFTCHKAMLSIYAHLLITSTTLGFCGDKNTRRFLIFVVKLNC